jgi:hypothetical protein
VTDYGVDHVQTGHFELRIALFTNTH